MTIVKLRKKDDPIARDVEKGLEDEGLSPMSPPDAYAPPGKGLEVAYEDLHPLLRAYRDEHEGFLRKLEAFEQTLTMMHEKGIDRSANAALAAFFEAIDDEVIPHNRREEKALFPLLAKRLVERGEHSKGSEPITAVDMLEDDHLLIVQLSALSYNLFALGSRLPDPASRLLVFDAAVEQGKALVELLRLHVFREDHVALPLAHKFLTTEELDALQP